MLHITFCCYQMLHTGSGVMKIFKGGRTSVYSLVLRLESVLIFFPFHFKI